MTRSAAGGRGSPGIEPKNADDSDAPTTGATSVKDAATSEERGPQQPVRRGAVAVPASAPPSRPSPSAGPTGQASRRLSENAPHIRREPLVDTPRHPAYPR